MSQVNSLSITRVDVRVPWQSTNTGTTYSSELHPKKKYFYIHCSLCPSSGFPLPQFLTLLLLPLAFERLSTGLPLPSLGPQSSWGLGTSPPTEVRPGCPLLYMCWSLWPAHVCCLVGGSVSGNSLRSGLVDTACLPVGWPFSLTSSVLPLIQL